MSRLNKLMQTYGMEAESEEALLHESGVTDPEALAAAQAEDAVEYEHPTLDSVRDAQELSEDLGELETIVESAPEEASVEHYHWMMDKLLAKADMPKAKALSLENFTGSASGKILLARNLSNYNGLLKSKIALALEAYTGNYAPAISNLADEVETQLRQVGQIANNPDSIKKTRRIKNARIWQMLHVNGELGSLDIVTEVSNLNRILKATSTALTEITDLVNSVNDKNFEAIVKDLEGLSVGSVKVSTLFNRRIKLDASGCTVDENKAPRPNKNVTYRGWAIFWFLTLFLFFWPGAIIHAFFAKYGWDEDEMKKHKDEVLNGLENLKQGNKAVAKINKDMEALAKALEDCKDSSVTAAARKAAAPALEGTSAVLGQYSDVISGTVVLAKLLQK